MHHLEWAVESSFSIKYSQQNHLNISPKGSICFEQNVQNHYWFMWPPFTIPKWLIYSKIIQQQHCKSYALAWLPKILVEIGRCMWRYCGGWQAIYFDAKTTIESMILWGLCYTRLLVGHLLYHIVFKPSGSLDRHDTTAWCSKNRIIMRHVYQTSMYCRYIAIYIYIICVLFVGCYLLCRQISYNNKLKRIFKI